PNSTPLPRSSINGIGRIAELGLGCLELAFVQGVKMSEGTAAQVAEAAGKASVRLTVHGPYAINLNSGDPSKAEASKERILKTARVGKLCGADSIVFHAGFYGDCTPVQAYAVMKRQLTEIMDILRRENNSISVRVELTGKGMDFGNLDELLTLAGEVPGLMPCIDFSHLHARTGGAFNTYDEFTGVLSKIEAGLGRKALDFLHAHVSGIKYGKHGEIGHLPLEQSDFRYQELLQALKDQSVKGFIICESHPTLEDDALLLQRTYRSLTKGVKPRSSVRPRPQSQIPMALDQ
ncbi:MAG: TIM barrel protein, partial [Chloroflexi bacterium]|nr:TIM barrel protein [Chloroflexota bacterium]